MVLLGAAVDQGLCMLYNVLSKSSIKIKPQTACTFFKKDFPFLETPFF